jgi:hypothetical protein
MSQIMAKHNNRMKGHKHAKVSQLEILISKVKVGGK